MFFSWDASLDMVSAIRCCFSFSVAVSRAAVVIDCPQKDLQASHFLKVTTLNVIYPIATS